MLKTLLFQPYFFSSRDNLTFELSLAHSADSQADGYPGKLDILAASYVQYNEDISTNYPEDLLELVTGTGNFESSV